VMSPTRKREIISSKDPHYLIIRLVHFADWHVFELDVMGRKCNPKNRSSCDQRPCFGIAIIL